MTPVMQQYLEIKKAHKDALVFFRLGDFYELFFEDAIIASEALDIVLTGREWGEKERAPMCGVPHHSAANYIARLIEKGHKVAVCEQTERASGKIIQREVIRVITPGTVTDENMLSARENCFIVCAYKGAGGWALAACDVSAGKLMAGAFLPEDGTEILGELAALAPREILLSSNFSKITESIEGSLGVRARILSEYYFFEENAHNALKDLLGVSNLESVWHTEDSVKRALEIRTAGALISYLQNDVKAGLSQIIEITPLREPNSMLIGQSALATLEVLSPLNPRGPKRSTLLGVLDETVTPPGARALRRYLINPSTDLEQIKKRQDAIEEWRNLGFARSNVREELRNIKDIERILGRLSGSVPINGNPRDMNRLLGALNVLPQIAESVSQGKSEISRLWQSQFDNMSDLRELIAETLTDSPPDFVNEGGIIREGANPELDELLILSRNAGNTLAELEEKERATSGIKNLKIIYNRVFGYVFELTKANIKDAPAHFIRKQTLTNAERFTTSELDALADRILSADERRRRLEYEIFNSLRKEIIENGPRIMFMAGLLASIDVILALAEVAARPNFVRPEIVAEPIIKIKNGRHPIIGEATDFAPNDTDLNQKNSLMLITGPNMAGKSTYMRQVALISIMAQTGSFVPAEEAIIGIADKIFARAGARDDLFSGQSTFMVEMTELAHILRNATNKSLVILDEIGRGTSAIDGLAIAWAALESVAGEARVLFATHYHQLTEASEYCDAVENYSFGAQQIGETTVFTRKLLKGPASKSYGIAVAKLAGLPASVCERAQDVLDLIENGEEIDWKGTR